MRSLGRTRRCGGRTRRRASALESSSDALCVALGRRLRWRARIVMRLVAEASAARQWPEVEGVRGVGRRGRRTSWGAVNEAALDLDRDFAGDRRRIGGLQRRRLRTEGRIGGDGDRVNFRSGDGGGVTEGCGQRLAARYIACVKRKNSNGFNMSARALGDASTSVERDVISVIRQNCGHAAATVPGAVMSVQVLSQCQSQEAPVVADERLEERPVAG